MKKLLKAFVLMAAVSFIPRAQAALIGPAVIITTGTLQPGTTNGYYVSKGTNLNSIVFNETSSGTFTASGSTFSYVNAVASGTITDKSTVTATGQYTFATVGGATNNISSTTYTGQQAFKNGITISTPGVAQPIFEVGTTTADFNFGGSSIAVFNNAGVAIKGRTDGSTPPNLYWNETVTASLNRSSAFSPTTNVIHSVSTMTLTAGNWRVSFACGYQIGVTATTGQTCCTSQTANACPSINTAAPIPNSNGEVQLREGNILSANDDDTVVGPSFNFIATTSVTLYLTSQVAFAGGTTKTYGWIQAIRNPY